MSLSAEERRELLAIARGAIEGRLRTGRLPRISPKQPALEREAGCFVSLHAGQLLRGCIGTFREDRPLYRVVSEMAVAAATQDPRFEPVALEELQRLTIEISVLTPRRRVSDPDEVVVGRHGVCIERGPNRGVLLPQVAVQEGWDRETFLDHTCLKAGLKPGCWRSPGTTIEVFEAEVFSEEDERSS
jgi:AmmeMemoRadiSam system protein A